MFRAAVQAVQDFDSHCSMIDVALNWILQQLNTDLGQVSPPEVVLGNVSAVESGQDSSTQSLTNVGIATVVNIEQEAALRNQPYHRKVNGNDGLPKTVGQPPEVFINVYVLFSANKNQYTESLRLVGDIIEFFQARHVFADPALKAVGIEKLIFDLHSLNFEALNHLWGINGSKYLPSVLYKMRLLIIQRQQPQDASVVTGIGATPQPL